MNDKAFLNPEMESMPLEQMRELQFKKLTKQMKYIYENSPDYRNPLIFENDNHRY